MNGGEVASIHPTGQRPTPEQNAAASQSRYEWRAWADQLSEVTQQIDRNAEHYEDRHSHETYVVTRQPSGANPKIRADRLDVKILRDVRDGYQRWEPQLKALFPVSASLVRDELLPLLEIAPPILERDAYTSAQLIEEIASRHPELAVVEVEKARAIYTVGGCIAEVADVVVGDVRMQTAAVESADLDALKATRRIVGLDAHPNIDYPEALRRVLAGEMGSGGSDG